ncbi:MAG: hypothetical protein C5B54_10455 [Acidobacteria bacterium]|nr:MAG: hypothetical protein C5B54_10455 [Acidobacteriota bacterium]
MVEYYDLSQFVSFDQYQRYLMIQRVITALNLSGAPILEVGAAYSPLRKLHSSNRVVSCDLTKAPNLHLRASGVKLPFVNEAFELVVNTDVLEHMPGEMRPSFLQEVARVSSKYLIVGFPHRTAAALEADQLLTEFIRKITGEEHVFLKDHLNYGLPEPLEIKSLLNPLMAHIVELKNANVHIWLRFMMADFAIQPYFHLNEARALMSESFRQFEPSTHSEPTYRTILVCSRIPLPDSISLIQNAAEGSR